MKRGLCHGYLVHSVHYGMNDYPITGKHGGFYGVVDADANQLEILMKSQFLHALVSENRTHKCCICCKLLIPDQCSRHGSFPYRVVPSLHSHLQHEEIDGEGHLLKKPSGMDQIDGGSKRNSKTWNYNWGRKKTEIFTEEWDVLMFIPVRE